MINHQANFDALIGGFRVNEKISLMIYASHFKRHDYFIFLFQFSINILKRWARMRKILKN